MFAACDKTLTMVHLAWSTQLTFHNTTWQIIFCSRASELILQILLFKSTVNTYLKQYTPKSHLAVKEDRPQRGQISFSCINNKFKTTYFPCL